ncbi:hypothetical protein PRIPAC_88679 [Pristionchus pacificus]|uniref:F-box domain-containing protein n=1 Tax=Pristionchus pacificus TaxID=54126 RepID=A0A2A6CVP2_PRIPA|nr:hypothetical protein PRIPAC_88679 [Pristionchus pacificus]|eukprot:PDM82170.1 hypothetical protein PRIPAC_36563 [Pristionchus pacificus]
MSPPKMSLASLPVDAVARILKFVDVEHFQNVRKISRRWNEIVLRHPFTKPAIDYISFLKLVDQWNFQIVLEKRHLNYFGLANWRKERVENETVTVRMEMLIKTDEEKEKLLNRLGLLFSRASTIAELEVKWLYQLYLIDSVMGRVKIDEFVASTHMVYPCQIGQVAKFVKEHTVRKFVLNQACLSLSNEKAERDIQTS